MKIEVGMYVRTERGKIWLVTSTKAIDGHRRRIVKASHNIIDLIEVGDYVDGIEINYKDEDGVYHGANDAWDEVHFTESKHVHNIVTKEQFEQMKYKVGE